MYVACAGYLWILFLFVFSLKVVFTVHVHTAPFCSFRTMFLDRDWFTLETASTLMANQRGLLHARLPPEQRPAAAAEALELAQQQQQQAGKQSGKQKQTKQQKQRDQASPPPPTVPLSAVETAATALSGINHHYFRPTSAKDVIFSSASVKSGL